MCPLFADYPSSSPPPPQSNKLKFLWGHWGCGCRANQFHTHASHPHRLRQQPEDVHKHRVNMLVVSGFVRLLVVVITNKHSLAFCSNVFERRTSHWSFFNAVANFWDERLQNQKYKHNCCVDKSIACITVAAILIENSTGLLGLKASVFCGLLRKNCSPLPSQALSPLSLWRSQDVVA